MKRLFAVALLVVFAGACKNGTAQRGAGSAGSIARQYDPQTYQTSHGDLDRAIGQR